MSLVLLHHKVSARGSTPLDVRNRSVHEQLVVQQHKVLSGEDDG